MMRAIIGKHELLKHLMNEVIKCGSQKELAKKLGMSPSYLGDVLNGKRNPGDKLLSAIGFEQVVVYRPKEDSAV